MNECDMQNLLRSNVTKLEEIQDRFTYCNVKLASVSISVSISVSVSIVDNNQTMMTTGLLVS